MIVLMLNTYDGVGGAGIAASRLWKGLQTNHVDCRMLVQFKIKGEHSDLLCNETTIGKMARSLKLFLELQPAVRYQNRPVANFTPAILPDALRRQVASIGPDLIHLHWLGSGFMRLETLPKFRQPIVWTLHDSWAFTGGCHVPFDCRRYMERCGSCPVLGSSFEKDISRWIWWRKAKAWRDLNLTVVAPSRWLADCARASSLFRDVRVEVIPNGLDLAVFRPIDKRLARGLLRLPEEKKLVLFATAHGTADKNKGFDLLLEALSGVATRLPKEAVELVVVGAGKPQKASPLPLKTHYLGQLRDELTLALAYAAADVLVSPSLLENLPNTVMEAMACGTPCVAFNQGGLPDLIEHQQSGYLAEPYEVADLARGIVWILADRDRHARLAAAARNKVVRDFDLEKVSQRYIDLYREVLAATAESL